ncbi:Hypothetical protein A7982_06159 [Minicystis rosea]|nr:Hypothetical protein A7982_06159 [Minicystis rosea]
MIMLHGSAPRPACGWLVASRLHVARHRHIDDRSPEPDVLQSRVGDVPSALRNMVTKRLALS